VGAKGELNAALLFPASMMLAERAEREEALGQGVRAYALASFLSVGALRPRRMGRLHVVVAVGGGRG
jgi:hypothetical protein